MTANTITIAAELAKVSGGYIVDITVIDARYGKRAAIATGLRVGNKREARKVAADHGATPWNF